MPFVSRPKQTDFGASILGLWRERDGIVEFVQPQSLTFSVKAHEECNAQHSAGVLLCCRHCRAKERRVVMRVREVEFPGLSQEFGEFRVVY